MGPLQHKFPFESDLTPLYDDRPQMKVRASSASTCATHWLAGQEWFDEHLLGIPPAVPVAQDVALYVRSSFAPGRGPMSALPVLTAALLGGPGSRHIPGHWIETAWPLRISQNLSLHFTGDHVLAESADAPVAEHRLRYQPNVGTQQGDGAGVCARVRGGTSSSSAGFYGVLPNMAQLDAQSLVYDYKVVQPLQVIGFVEVCLTLSVEPDVAGERESCCGESVVGGPEQAVTVRRGSLGRASGGRVRGRRQLHRSDGRALHEVAVWSVFCLCVCLFAHS